MKKTFKDMEKEVNKFLKKQKYSNRNIDIIQLANNLNFEVHFSEFKDLRYQFLISQQENKKYLIINKKMSYHKHRFTIACAIAYYLLKIHNNEEDFLYKWIIEENNIVTKDVFCFAIILLLNKKQFIDKYNDLLDYDKDKEYISKTLSCYFSTPKEIIDIAILNYCI